jgi:hypothetical protein
LISSSMTMMRMIFLLEIPRSLQTLVYLHFRQLPGSLQFCKLCAHFESVSPQSPPEHGPAKPKTSSTAAETF